MRASAPTNMTPATMTIDRNSACSVVCSLDAVSDPLPPFCRSVTSAPRPVLLVMVLTMTMGGASDDDKLAGSSVAVCCGVSDDDAFVGSSVDGSGVGSEDELVNGMVDALLSLPNAPSLESTSVMFSTSDVVDTALLLCAVVTTASPVASGVAVPSVDVRACPSLIVPQMPHE